MNANSKYFDSLRIKPRRKSAAPSARPVSTGMCEWPGCQEKGGYKAPKGRGREGEFYNFCVEHVREYNKSYNYFEGMSDTDIAEQQKTTNVGDRPTWKMGVNGSAKAKSKAQSAQQRKFAGFKVDDPFATMNGDKIPGEDRSEPKRSRPVRRLEKRSLEKLNLSESATGEEIRARYKELVKMHHPDANGGDRSSEDRLRDIIQAYKHLKSVGFC